VRRAGLPALQQTHLVPQHEDLHGLVAAVGAPHGEQVDEERDEMREYEPEHKPLTTFSSGRRRDQPRPRRS